MICAFEKTGISLKVDDSEDAEKMKFQAQEIGIPLGLDIDQFAAQAARNWFESTVPALPAN